MPSTRPLEPFDLSVLRSDDEHVWLSVVCRQGNVHAVPRKLPAWPAGLASETISEWLGSAVGMALPRRDQGARVGHALGAVVFGLPEVADLFAQTRGVAASEGSQILVRLMAAPGDVAAWPWELMTDPADPSRPLTLARDAHVVRAARTRTYPIRQGPIEPPLNLLLVLSSPLRGPGDSEAVFDLYQEKRALLGELQPLVDRGLLRVVVEDRPSIQRLRRRLGAERRGFHLLHFLGHAQPAGLNLEDHRRGRVQLVRSARFSELLQQVPDLRLVVFAGCETARAPDDPSGGAWPGVLSTADYTVRDAAPAVIGMQAVLPFGTERTFTRFFYQAVTAGHSLAEALRLARWAIWDDDSMGTQLLDWAVPTLFVGGSAPGPVLDPEAKAARPRPIERAALKVGVHQADLRFFARQTELREAIDVLAGRTAVRLLVIAGPAGVGKTRLLDRTLEELDPEVAQLHLAARVLLEAADPLQELCRIVAEVLRDAGIKVRAKGRRTPAQWWTLLLEDLTTTRFALVLDGADVLADDHPVVVALGQLAERRGNTRLAISRARARGPIASELSAEQWRAITLAPHSWQETWQWIRRNLPVLTRLGEDRLLPYFSDLGPRLEHWEQLARALTGELGAVDDGELSTMVGQLAGETGAAGLPPPPLFGAAGESVEPVLEPLTVAVAGPFTEGRETQFVRSITGMAAKFDVAGRVVGEDALDRSASLARLLSTPSPFQSGSATAATILGWLGEVLADRPDVVVLDYGSPRESLANRELFEQATRLGTLLIAAGGNSGKPAYPAWHPGVLAIGALDEEGAPTAYSPYFADAGKPELYAPRSLAGTPLAELVTQHDAQGTTFAAIYAAAAAVLVWASYRTLSATEIREILLSTADRGPAGAAEPVARLDLPAALERTRQELLLDVLERGRMATGQLLAESGLPSSVALAVLDRLVEGGRVAVRTEGSTQIYENPRAIYRQYEQLRSELPVGGDRTGRLEELVNRARALAWRGHFERADIAQLWQNGGPGPRIVALAIMQELPETRAWPLVVDAINRPRSAFEQYQALQLAELMAMDLPEAERAELRNILATEPPDNAPWGNDRKAVAASIEAVLNGRKDGLDVLSEQFDRRVAAALGPLIESKKTAGG